MASSSEELGAQAAALRDLVSKFQVEPTKSGTVELARGKSKAGYNGRPVTQRA
jgi:hypothetical protein